MILPLRARHRAMITTLAVVAPAVFALALGKRSSVRPSPAPDLSTWNEPTLIPVGADWTVLLNPLMNNGFRLHDGLTLRFVCAHHCRIR